MFLEATRTQSVAVSRAAALCVSYANLCSYVPRGKRLTQTLYLMFLCPYVLLFPALAAAKPRYDVSFVCISVYLRALLALAANVVNIRTKGHKDIRLLRS